MSLTIYFGHIVVLVLFSQNVLPIQCSIGLHPSGSTVSTLDTFDKKYSFMTI